MRGTGWSGAAQHAELALGDDGHRQAMNDDVRTARPRIPGTDARFGGHHLARDLDRGGVEQPGEADEQHEREREAEQLHPPVAAEREQVEAQLMREQGGHRVSSR